MNIDQHTELYGVIGRPIGHSLSPVMHNAALRETGHNAVYLAFETGDLRGCIEGMKALGIKGLSVTIPFKSEVIPLLDGVDPLAAKIGAVNTIVNHGGRLIGYNTDAVGALRSIEEKIPVPGITCLIIGAGGAAKAIGFILKKKGAQVTITNRSEDRGKALAEFLECPFIPLNESGGHQSDLFIHTTPVGMSPHNDQCLIPEEMLKKDMTVMDIVYTPLETKLLAIARNRGCRTINGLGMLVYQGAEQFRLWTGSEPPVDTMRRALEKAIRVPKVRSELTLHTRHKNGGQEYGG
ncbi:MAG: shikimate dehydrogenase [Deltaproteobacteria bacterium]|nr:shikimate dehydrogenase [Deltaproteobacteria bacterium]